MLCKGKYFSIPPWNRMAHHLGHFSSELQEFILFGNTLKFKRKEPRTQSPQSNCFLVWSGVQLSFSPRTERGKKNYYRIPRWIPASITSAGLSQTPRWQHRGEHSNSLLQLRRAQWRSFTLHQVIHQDLNCPKCGVHAPSKTQDEFRWYRGKLLKNAYLLWHTEKIYNELLKLTTMITIKGNCNSHLVW